MALPTQEELNKVETFRGKVADILTEEEVSDDLFLVRWLRARDLDVEKAEAMLRNAIKWRKDNKVAIMVFGKSCEPYFYENFPGYVDGVDKEGRPVLCAPFGKWDVRKVVNQGRSEEFITYLTEYFEKMSNAIKVSAARHPPKPGCPPVTQVVLIYDWAGFAWSQLFSYKTVQNFLQIGAIYEAYYPEILHTCYFINCPSLISTVLMLLKPVIAPRTMEKIKCFGTDKKSWQAELLQHIEADQLRPQFGGIKDNDDSPFDWQE